jgi:23S rRNA (guanosine2251-2'-O)-methyltransferase
MKHMKKIMLIAHNIRSTHNVGSLLRTAEGLGINSIIFTGYTPYPQSMSDSRLPHLATKINNQIKKTSLGAESMVDWRHDDSIQQCIALLHSDGYTVAALEQHTDSVSLPTYKTPDKIALIVGREVEGIEPEIIELCDICLEIPMFGKKESYNVAQAAAMALYHLKLIG